MFITVYGKYGPQPPKNHVINTNLIQKIQTYQPLFGKEKYYDKYLFTIELFLVGIIYMR